MIHMFVRGEPHVAKTGSNKSALRQWQDIVEKQTDGMKRMKGPCQVRLDFVLPPGSFKSPNKKVPYGPDLDNLVEAVLDALATNVFPDGVGDNAATQLLSTKREATKGEEPGVMVTVVDLVE